MFNLGTTTIATAWLRQTMMANDTTVKVPLSVQTNQQYLRPYLHRWINGDRSFP